jgi:lipoyl synthase
VTDHPPVIPPAPAPSPCCPANASSVPGWCARRRHLAARGRKPEWLKVKASFGDNFKDVTKLMEGLELNTVCAQAACPNIYECWEMREATFLIGGEDCTRRCGFCQIKTGKPKGYDTDEPRRVAEAVEHLGLRFAVVTMVARDDLDDGGAWLVAETIRQIRARTPDVGVEVLPSDFGYGHDPARARRRSSRSSRPSRTCSRSTSRPPAGCSR